MSCGCQQSTAVNKWTPNCPNNQSSTSPNFGGANLSGKFCWTCFLFWVALAVIVFLVLAHGGKKGKK